MNSLFWTLTFALIALTEIASTASITTSTSCLGAGETCISFTDGSGGTCCGGVSLCSVYVPTVGFVCASDSPTTSPCLAEGELCLSITEGSKGTCCGGSCNNFDQAKGGYLCSNDATTTSASPTYYTSATPTPSST